MRYTTRIIVPPRVRRSGAPGSPGGAYRPQVIGVRRSFGFGDRLGVATPGHLAALAGHPGFAPVFAQQSVHELTLTGRTPQEVISAAIGSVNAARYRQPWGADADRLKLPQDVDAAAAAGFTWFTIDPSDFFRHDADELAPDALAATIDALVADGELPEDWSGPYLERAIDLPGDQRLRIGLEPLQRAVVKFGRAINHCARMSEAIARANQGRPYEIEVACDGTATPATTLEHLFIGLELEARGVRLTGLSLRFPGEAGPTAGFQGDLAEFEARLKEHVAVAQFCGPYKLSFDRGADKLEAYPIIGRCCGEALHVKSSGLSFLEALRVVSRVEPGLFGQIVRYCRARITGGTTPEIPATVLQSIARLPDDAAGDEELVFIDGQVGRRMFHATYGSLLTVGCDEQGRPFKEAILELLDRHADMYHEVLAACFDTHLRLLDAG